MALEWMLVGSVAAAEAAFLLILTVPAAWGLSASLRRALVTASHSALRPLIAVVPFCLFLMLDIYWKYETRPNCGSGKDGTIICSPADHLRFQKSAFKSQRNMLLVASALLLYWFLFAISRMLVRIEQLSQRVEKLKNQD